MKNFFFLLIFSLVALNSAYAEKCYLVVEKSGDYNPETIANFTAPLISQYIEKIEYTPMFGVKPTDCQYNISLSETQDGFSVSILGRNASGLGDSEKSGMKGIKQSIIMAIYRARPNKKKEICDLYGNMIPENCGMSSSPPVRQQPIVKKETSNTQTYQSTTSGAQSVLPGNTIFQINLREYGIRNVDFLRFSKDANTLLIGTNDHPRKILIWDISSGTAKQLLKNTGNSASFSNDGRVVAVAKNNHKQSFYLIDTTSYQVTDYIGEAEGISISDGIVKSSPAENYFAVGGSGYKTVYLISYPELNIQRTINSPQALKTIAVSHNGKMLATAGYDSQNIKVWNTQNGWGIKTLKASFKMGSGNNRNKINSVAFSPDGKYVVAGDGQGKLSLLDVKTGKEIRAFKLVKRGSDHKVNSVIFSPDGKMIIAGGSKEGRRGIIVVWDAKTGNKLKAFEPPGGGGGSYLKEIAFSPNGQFLAVGHGRIVSFFGE